ncbi:MAG: DUF3656 domain-containing U32 family peptidase [Peptococcales bacterium]|jgi:putative protease
MQKIELLAPAGSMEAFRAAVLNGANAVYLGGSMFSARQYAGNFNSEELKEAVNFAHNLNVKIYVAVNTLVANEEMNDLFRYLYQLAESQIDGIIVQDLGVSNIIRKTLPQIELHASTQMAIHNSLGVKYLENMGFSRAVLAREVSFDDIKLIREQSSLELETFVHGALCISYSGQCLMSSMIGGRSGNRGRCAQPCRMKYSLVDRKGNLLAQLKNTGEHLLSPRDLKMIEHIPELVESGIVSLKIEGRMKRPEYVATVVRNYREALDRYYENPEKFKVNEIWEKELEQIFNRDFTTGYYFSNQGKELMSYKRPNNRGLLIGRITKIQNGLIYIKLIEPLTIGDGYEVWVTKGGRVAGEIKELFLDGKKISEAVSGQEVAFKASGKPRIGDRVFKTHDIKLIQKAQESYLSSKVGQNIDLHLELIVREGEKIQVNAWDARAYHVQVMGDFIVEKAQKHAIDYDTLRKQFARLGNTPFKLASLDAQINGSLMVPVSELNQIRRKIVEGLLNKRYEELRKPIPSEEQFFSKINDLKSGIPRSHKEKVKPQLSVLVGNPEGVKAALQSGADLIYFNWEGLKNKPGFSWHNIGEGIDLCKKQKVKAILCLPRLVAEKDLAKLNTDLQKLMQYHFQGVLVGNLGTLHLIEQFVVKKIYVDYSLNVFNDFTLQKLIEEKTIQATLSPELTLKQIKKFSHLGRLPLEVIIHGNFPLMTSEHCVVGSILGNKTSQNICPGACSGLEVGLKDRMNLVFPLEMDINCRMLVYNTKPLNLYKDLKSILDSGINVIRIEARKENANWIKTVTQIYRRAIDDWFNLGEDYATDEKVWKTFEKLQPEGFTTGHFFRGVL